LLASAGNFLTTNFLQGIADKCRQSKIRKKSRRNFAAGFEGKMIFNNLRGRSGKIQKEIARISRLASRLLDARCVVRCS